MTARSSSDKPDVDHALLDRLDAGEPPRTPEEASARAPYERLISQVKALDEIEPPAGWEGRAFNRWSEARRAHRIRRGVALGAVAVAALVAAVLLWPRAGSDPASLEVAVLSSHGPTHRGDAAVGMVLRARARAGQPTFELRLYLAGRLVARCPAATSCTRDGAALQLDWQLAEPGSYRVVVMSSGSSIPNSEGSLDRDLLAARTAGITIETRAVEVSP